MAYINVDEVYILDNTGLQVDMATDIPFADAGFSDAQKEQARKNIAAGGSNENLLDNAYFVGGGSQLGNGVFPINQLGLTYYESIGDYIDRWKSNSPWGSPIKCALQSEGVVLAGDVVPSYPTAYTQLSQVLASPPVGKTVTLSILTDSVTPDSEGDPPFLYTNDSGWTPITVGLTSVTFVWASGVTQIGIILPDGATSAASLRMQAIKLEEGSVSTIQNDAPPDFRDELRKCQSYLFIRDYAQNDIIANGLTNNLTMFLPASMRSGGSPTMTFTATPYVIGNGVISTPTSVNLASVNGNQVQIYAPTTESHNAQTIVLYAGSATRMTIANVL